MEIYLGRRGVRQIRDAAHEAMEEGETEALREEIVEAFASEDVQAMERHLGGEDLYDFISAMLDDWSGDDVDELFDLLESQFAEVGIELTTEYSELEEKTEVVEEDDEFTPPESFEDEEP
jgi:hypothetical protein